MFVRTFAWLACLTLAYAWWDVAHMVTAELATRHLTSGAAERIALILESSVEDIFTTVEPGEAYTDIRTSSVWPDDIKFFVHAFDTWHYVDVPWVDGVTDPTFEPPPLPLQNAQWLLDEAKSVCLSEDANTWSRAFFLRFLLHTAGDVHQPLHTIERYTDEFINGDFGGNLFYIVDTENPTVTNLHAFWDSGAGLFENSPYPEHASISYIEEQADLIEEFHPFDSFPEALRDTDDFAMWVNESYWLARTVVYKGVEPNENITQEYRGTAQVTITQRVALGGYRLAYVLNTLFSDNTGPETPSSSGLESWSDLEKTLLGSTIGLGMALVALGTGVWWQSHRSERKYSLSLREAEGYSSG